ncbi:hypothetical protein [Streptomyces sp. NPDC046862]|uniref:hypothetical protein n=1 Tax=Streptomyces sp. NPDC046862 TaxID=3154603 RepID=UPI0034564531
MMLEDVATSLTGPDEWEAWQRVLASLGSLPVGYRRDLGRFLFDALAAVTEAASGTTAAFLPRKFSSALVDLVDVPVERRGKRPAHTRALAEDGSHSGPAMKVHTKPTGHLVA